ncbi:MAG: penicillin-binding protein activator [Proteobacteria bacterium]|nr:penicillin-binding protein activator [Pseudomonadota bacterium]
MRIIYLFVVILLTSSCGNQVIRPDKSQYDGLEQAQIYYTSHDYTNAANAYMQLYWQYRHTDFAVFAADSYLQIGQFKKAKQTLSIISPDDLADLGNLADLGDNPLYQLPLYQLIWAELNIRENNYRITLNNIEGELRPRYLQLKASIDQYNQDYINAALALIELSQLDPMKIDLGNIINNLSLTSEIGLTQALFDFEISELQQGWLEAALVASSQDNSSIQDWKNRWGSHPANAFFILNNSYENIAVLLPLTGRYKDISKSIQQGMIAAIYQNKLSKQNLSFFDTGSSGENFVSAWYGAIESGAEFIIGPLEKQSIQKMSQLPSSTVPVLLLNKLQTNNPQQPSNAYGVYQFPLSAEDEVSNVVSRLIAENKKRIMLLAPESRSGRKLAQLFETQLIEKGGEVTSHAFYPESVHDYSREIKLALGLDQSTVRARQLKSIIGTSFKYESQIRPDIDAIFILARPKQARLIKPQLKFFKAESLPVYSTSQIHSNTTDTALNKDLNGIKFCQSAFVIDPLSLQEHLSFDVTSIDSQKKYFALGFDAINLYPRLEWMQTMQNQSIEGLSGHLSVDGNGRVHRKLAWAQFKRGKAELLPPLNPPLNSRIDNHLLSE